MKKYYSRVSGETVLALAARNSQAVAAKKTAKKENTNLITKSGAINRHGIAALIAAGYNVTAKAKAKAVIIKNAAKPAAKIVAKVMATFKAKRAEWLLRVELRNLSKRIRAAKSSIYSLLTRIKESYDRLDSKGLMAASAAHLVELKKLWTLQFKASAIIAKL